MRTSAKQMALGGILGALAMVIMSLGGMIPIATYVCPMLSMLLLNVVLQLCGKRVAWAWYGAVAILGLLVGPDKEAAAVFVFLGYYPIIKSVLDRMKPGWLWKLLFFNGVTILMYTLLMHLFGMAQLSEEFTEMGCVMLAVVLAMGNLTFLLLDRVLSRLRFKK